MSKQIIFGIGEDFLKHEGLKPEVAEWEDGLRADTGPGAFEWWYFDAHFSDGTTAVVVFYTKPFTNRHSPLRPGVTITLTSSEGSKRFLYAESSPEDFNASRETCHVQMGECHVQGDLHTYTLHARAEDVVLDLTFTGDVPAWRPGTGKNYYDPALTRYFGWLPAVPFGKVSGTLQEHGKSRPVSGEGYHDHNWGNVNLNQVLSHWYWGRARLGRFSLIFVEMHASAAYGMQKIPVFMLAENNRILTGDARPLTLLTSDFTSHPSHHSWPRKLDWVWKAEAGSIRLRLEEPRLLEAASLLGSLPRWQQGIARLFANPFYFRFDASAELDVVFGSTRAHETGHALYEMMILH